MKIKLLIFGLAVSTIAGCKTSVDPRVATTKVSVRSAASKTASGLDTTTVDAMLRFSTTFYCSSPVTMDTSVSASCVFTNDSAPAAITSAVANGATLSEVTTGTYSAGGTALWDGSGFSKWWITGWEGGNLGDTTLIPGPIFFTGVHTGDTVSKLSGFTISYSGSQGGDLNVTLYSDRGTTEDWIDSTTAATCSGSYNSTLTDGGSVSFSPTDLAGFTAGVYIRLQLHHWEYHVDASTTGRKAGVFTDNSATIILFLAP